MNLLDQDRIRIERLERGVCELDKAIYLILQET
jgi:hypothetical protein